nr:hypothetical protein Iba_chr01fCG7380 [Ipomoea batatas]
MVDFFPRKCLCLRSTSSDSNIGQRRCWAVRGAREEPGLLEAHQPFSPSRISKSPPTSVSGTTTGVRQSGQLPWPSHAAAISPRSLRGTRGGTSPAPSPPPPPQTPTNRSRTPAPAPTASKRNSSACPHRFIATNNANIVILRACGSHAEKKMAINLVVADVGQSGEQEKSQVFLEAHQPFSPLAFPSPSDVRLRHHHRSPAKRTAPVAFPMQQPFLHAACVEHVAAPLQLPPQIIRSAYSTVLTGSLA